MEKSIYERINSAQLGSKADMLYLIDKFQPLIKKHSYHLNYDDSIGDVTLAFIEIIHKIKLAGFVQETEDYAILSYIKRSMENEFFYLGKKKAQHAINAEFDESINSPIITDKLSESFEIRVALSKLTKLQREVVLLKIYYGYTDVEIGKVISISRQAVNRIKNRALASLEKQLSDNRKTLL